MFADLQLIQMRERIGQLFAEDDYTAVVVNNDAEYLEMRPYCALMDIDLDAPDSSASPSPSPTAAAPPPPPPAEPKSRARARPRSTLFGGDGSKVLYMNKISCLYLSAFSLLAVRYGLRLCETIHNKHFLFSTSSFFVALNSALKSDCSSYSLLAFLRVFRVQTFMLMF